MPTRIHKKSTRSLKQYKQSHVEKPSTHLHQKLLLVNFSCRISNGNQWSYMANVTSRVKHQGWILWHPVRDLLFGIMQNPGLITSLEGPACPCHDDVAPNSIGSCQTVGTTNSQRSWRFKEFVYIWLAVLKYWSNGVDHIPVWIYTFMIDRVLIDDCVCWPLCVHDISASTKTLSLAWRHTTVSCHSWQPAMWIGRKNQTRTQKPDFDRSHGHTLPNVFKYLHTSTSFLDEGQLQAYIRLYKYQTRHVQIPLYFFPVRICVRRTNFSHSWRENRAIAFAATCKCRFTKNQVENWVSKTRTFPLQAAVPCGAMGETVSTQPKSYQFINITWNKLKQWCLFHDVLPHPGPPQSVLEMSDHVIGISAPCGISDHLSSN